MTPTTTRQWLLAKKPNDLPILSGPDATYELTTKQLPPLEDDQVLIKILHLSNDPAQRQWIDPNITPSRLYTTPVEVGDVVASFAAVAEIVESRSNILPVGQLVTALAGWTEYAVVPAAACTPITMIEGLPPTHSAALFGLAGVTAYYGLVDIAQAGPEDAVVVSGAAGAVGSLAVQIAKHVLGCKKVIGVAGTDTKCRWVESLGADVCLNYKSPAFESELEKATEGFVEVFFDNTGGPVLDLMLKNLKKDGRVAACGAIANYNDSDPYGIKNWYHLIAMRIQIRGFVAIDALPTGRWSEIVSILVRSYKEGNIKAPEDIVTIVPATFEEVPKTWMMLFSGQAKGKLLTELV